MATKTFTMEEILQEFENVIENLDTYVGSAITEQSKAFVTVGAVALLGRLAVIAGIATKEETMATIRAIRGENGPVN